MAAKTKHYTSVEKKIFLDVLKEYKDIVETKKSDSSTLREKNAAWNEIGLKYNNSFQINEKRTVIQLKKLWTNLKQTQRNAITQEKQASMVTGCGPQAPPAEVDPDVAMIAPHLMEVAPAQFSSNIPPEHQNDYRIEMAESEDDTEELEYLDVALLNTPTENECDKSVPGTSSSFLQDGDSQSGTARQVIKKPRVTKRQRSSVESTGQSVQRDVVKLKRIARLCEKDEQVHEIRARHELKVAKLKECHLNVMNQLREEHLTKIHHLEIRKATAEAELAELKLARERDCSIHP